MTVCSVVDSCDFISDRAIVFVFADLQASPNSVAVVDLHFASDKCVENVLYPELSRLSQSKAVAYSVTKYVICGFWLDSSSQVICIVPFNSIFWGGCILICC